MAAIPADRFTQPVAVSGAQRQRGVAFFGGTHPPHFAEPLRPGHLPAEVLEHAAAGFHRCQLVGVSDEHHLGASGDRGRQQFFQLRGADHGGLVDDDDGVPVDGQGVVLDELERFGHGQATVAGLLLHGLIDGFAGGGEHEHFFVPPVRGGAQRFERVGFASTGGGLQGLHQKRGHGDVADRAFLVGGKVTEVGGAHVEAAAVVGGVHHVEDAGFLEHDRLHGELLVAFAVVSLARCADAHTDVVDERLDERARFPDRVDGQLRTDDLHHVGARERGLVDVRRHVRDARPVQGGARMCAPLSARGEVRIAVQVQTARISAPRRFEFFPGELLGLGGPRRFLRGGQLRRGGFTVDDDEVVFGPFPQSGRSLRPRLNACRSDAGDFGHAGMLVDGLPFEAALGVQHVAQGGLVDDPGGLGFVIQRLRIDRHQPAISTGLPIRQNDVSVQVRVPAPARLMLIGDRHQPGQPLEVFVAGQRVVHPRVPGVLVQVGHRGFDRCDVGVLQDLLGHVIAGQRPQQRHTLGRGEHQVKPVHAVGPERPAGLPIGRHAIVEPARRGLGVSKPAVERGAVESGGLTDGGLVADHDPGRDAGVAFGVVLAQAAAGGLTVHRGLPGLIGGVVVVADAPATQPRDRQHGRTATRAPHQAGQAAARRPGFGRASTRSRVLHNCANVPLFRYWKRKEEIAGLGRWLLWRLVMGGGEVAERWQCGDGVERAGVGGVMRG